MKKKFYLLGLLLFIPPIALAYILHCDTIFGWEIAGGENDWVTFWGNYSGGIFSGLISFVILYKTLKHNHDENRNMQVHTTNENVKQRSYDHLQQMRRDIAERFSHLDIQRIKGSIEEKESEDSPIAEANRLKSLAVQIWDDYNSLDLIYGGEIDHILSRYKKIVDDYAYKSNTLSHMFLVYSHCINQYDREDRYKAIKDYCVQLNSMISEINSLWDFTKKDLNTIGLIDEKEHER